MQIVLKRTEKASPKKIDLRTSFLGIRRDPTAFLLPFPAFFPVSQRDHSETHICFFFFTIRRWSQRRTRAGGQVNGNEEIQTESKEENRISKYTVCTRRVQGQRENSRRQPISRALAPYLLIVSENRL